MATSCCSAMSSIMSCTWSTSMFLCAAFSASAAFFIVVSTCVLVLALSSASRCISMVDRVPSICCSCFSYRFLRFSAWMAADGWRTTTNTRQHYRKISLVVCMSYLLLFVVAFVRKRVYMSHHSPRLFFVPFLRAVSSSNSIFCSRKSCFFSSMCSVSRSFWMASPVVGATSFLPPNILPMKLMVAV